jgi:hypothetical protein
MLAPLMADPPTGDDQLIKELCSKHGVLDFVEERVAKFA